MLQTTNDYDTDFVSVTSYSIEEITYSEWLTKCPFNIDEQQLDELLKKTYPEKFL